MPSGGSVAFLYGFIFCVICNLCMSASLAEMSSIWPTAGGQYHWAYALSTDEWRISMVCLYFCLFLPIEKADSEQSYLVGWINIAGWLTLITTEAFFAGVCSHPQSVIRTDRV